MRNFIGSNGDEFINGKAIYMLQSGPAGCLSGLTCVRSE